MRVWDLPTRLFHWVLAVTVLGSVVSAKVGGAAMVWHFRLGYVVFALLAILAPLLFPASQLDVTQAAGMPYEPPSGAYWLGTDVSGRSVLALVVWGARVSLIVGLSVAAISSILGLALGLLCGYFRRVDGLVMRASDLLLAFPAISLVLVRSFGG